MDYVQKSGVFGAKDLGGKLINGDWKYDIISRYSANAKIEAAKISKYATESPYETFAEGYLSREKDQEIPESIAKVIDEAERKAGVKNVTKELTIGESGNIENLRKGDNKVSLSNIDTESYRRKFNQITGNTSVNETLRKYSKAMLTHRNGTDGEDLYIISSKTVKRLFSKTTGSNELGVELNKNEIQNIKQFAKDEGVIVLHNHPTNLLPTGSDFVSAGARGYDFGLVVTHDGGYFGTNLEVSLLEVSILIELLTNMYQNHTIMT